MMRSTWTPFFIVAALLLLLTYLLLKSQSPDLALRARIDEALQTFELHDTEFVRDVLRARAGLLPNYDSLAQTRHNLVRDLEILHSKSLSAADHDAQALLSRHVQALAAVVQEKLQMVEHFKSDNALLRNSLTYLINTQAILGSKVNAERTVTEEIGQLAHSLLSFMHNHQNNVSNEIQAVLDHLANAASSEADFQTLAIHGRLVVNLLPEVDTLLHQIITTPTAAHTQALQNAVWQYSGRVEARAQIFRLLLYLVAVMLLVYLTYQFIKLRAIALQWRRTNADLNHEMDERQQAEAALRTSEERLRAITESAKEAIVTANSAGNVVSWNAGAKAIFGYTLNEILGKPFIHLIPKQHHALHKRVFFEQTAIDHSPMLSSTIEITGLRKDGSELPLEVSLSIWSMHHERHITAIIRDITERKRLEATTRQQELQLIQANKMTALGTLVSGVAHEINNPNQFVLLNSRVLAEVWDDALDILDKYYDRNTEFTLNGLPYTEMRQNIPELIRGIHDGALRIERIVSDLKDFARPPALGKQAVFQINETVERARRLLAHLITKQTAHFQLHLAPNLPPLRGDAQQIEQVVVNLMVNALEALPDREKSVSVSTSIEVNRPGVVLEVRDEGVGIAHEHLARLCDPFFTTKQASGGTGLGLAITASLVRTHGAELIFASELGRGTQAVVRFPVIKNEDTMATP